MESGCLGGALFFYGREQLLIDWAIGAIMDKYLNPAVVSLEFSKISGPDRTVDEIKNCCETLPMLSEKRVVLVPDFSVLAGEKEKHFGEAEEKELIDYLKTMPETTLLIFTGQKADKRKKIYKTISESGAVYEFSELSQPLLVNFIQKRLKAAGKTAGKQAISTFVELSGYYDKDTEYTLYNIENDVKKAICHAQGQEVTAEDFGITVAGNIDTNVFSMLDFISRGQKGEAFVLLHNILDSGDSVYKLLALICSQFELMLSVKEMQEEGLHFSGIQKELGVHEFRVKKAMEFARQYSVKHLRAILRQAYEVDKNIKTGLLEQRLALEMLIAAI